PKPAAAFSTFTTARSIRYWSRSRGRSLARAARPGSPNTSPTMRMFMSLRDFDGSGLPDDDDLDVTRVLHLGLDALGDVLGELMGVEVGHDVGARHHPQLAAGLDGVAHLHALVAEGDLLELGQPLDVALQHVAARPWPRGRDAVGGLGEHGLDGL